MVVGGGGDGVGSGGGDSWKTLSDQSLFNDLAWYEDHIHLRFHLADDSELRPPPAAHFLLPKLVLVNRLFLWHRSSADVLLG